jgi:nicotinamide riboside kinase
MLGFSSDMKIAFIGAQGVGKTTLSRMINNEISSSLIVRESVRECPYPCDQNADFKTEWWILNHSILAEQEARESKKDLVITDRCLLDIAVYTKLINETKDGRITDLQRKMIDGVILDWMKEDPYDFIYLIKVNPTIWKTRDLDDGFRSLDQKWYEILTSEFEKAIEKFGISKLTQLRLIENDGSIDDCYQRVKKDLTTLKS